MAILGFGETKAQAEAQTLLVKKARCPQNHPCPSIKVCPTGALTQAGYAAPEVDLNKCIKCVLNAANV